MSTTDSAGLAHPNVGTWSALLPRGQYFRFAFLKTLGYLQDVIVTIIKRCQSAPHLLHASCSVQGKLLLNCLHFSLSEKRNQTCTYVCEKQSNEEQEKKDF